MLSLTNSSMVQTNLASPGMNSFATTNYGRASATNRQVPTGSIAHAGFPGKAMTLEAGDRHTTISTQSVTPVGRLVTSLGTGVLICGTFHRCSCPRYCFSGCVLCGFATQLVLKRESPIITLMFGIVYLIITHREN